MVRDGTESSAADVSGPMTSPQADAGQARSVSNTGRLIGPRCRADITSVPQCDTSQ